MISADATIAIERSETDPLLASIRPFVSKTAAGIRSGLKLSAAVDLAGREYPDVCRHFLIEGDLSTFGLKHHLLFPEEDRVNRFVFRNRRTGQTLQINNVTPEEVRGIGNTLEVLARKDIPEQLLPKVTYPELAAALKQVEVFVDQTSTTDWELPAGCGGIFRLQHASFLLQSKKARVLVDPHFVSVYSIELQPRSFMLPHDFNQLNVDAIVITHSHTDHYDIPSLMMMPRNTLMIVPRVSGDSILSLRFGDELRAIGFRNVVEQDWYSEPIRVEDIEVSAVPFYGEQPLRYEHPRDRLLRNWGNSYVFRTPEFSSWCLIDSGSDASGSMIDVADTVKNQFGSIDVVLSNLHEFFVGVGWGNPFYTTGGGEYWLSLTADQIVRFPEMGRDMITLGPKGVAEICATVKARTFLPYAHLWSDVGTAPLDEPFMLQTLRTQPAIARSPIDIQSWRIGDLWHP